MEDLRETSTQLNNAVQGLNELMEEALRIAGQAAHDGRPDEIAAIFKMPRLISEVQVKRRK